MKMTLAVLALAATAFAAEPQVAIEGGGMAWGPGVFRDHIWASVTSTVTNPTDGSVDALVVTRFEQTPQMQFATPVWLPPRSRFRVIQPVRVFDVPTGKGFVNENVTTLLVDPSVAPERRWDLYEGPLPITTVFPIVAFMGDGMADDAARTMTSFGAQMDRQREAEPGESGRTQLLRQKRLLAEGVPRFAAGWDAVDSAVIAWDAPRIDAAQIAALRQWLIAGGRLWVLLDQVPPTFCARLLGEDFTCRVVDYVHLGRVALDGRDGDGSVFEVETPVKMARVLASGFEVIHTVDGWPASMARSIGRGRVLLTTIGPGAWVDAEQQARPPLNDLRPLVLDVVDSASEAQATLRDFIAGQIGYTVVGRGPVLLVFVVLTAALLGAGLWLRWRQSRPGRAAAGLERIGLIGIGLSLAATLVLAVLDAVSHGQVPTTVAGVQLVQATRSPPGAIVSGGLGFYTPPPRSEPLSIKADAGGLIWLDPESFVGEAPRMIWTDFDQWYWQQPDLRPGAMQMAQVRSIVAWDAPARAKLSFGAKQLRLRVERGPLSALADPVLAVPNGHLVPIPDGAAEFVIPGGQAPGPDQFFAGGVALSDLQARRQVVLRQLAASTQAPLTVRFAPEPMLLAWADAIDLDLDYAPNAERRESALVAIPVDLVRPDPGTQVSVPAAFIALRHDDPLGKLKGGPYEARRRTWVDMISSPRRFVVRFQLPEAVVPMQITAARLNITIDASGWKLALFDPFRQDTEPLKERVSPMGTIGFDLDEWPVLLETGADGAVYVKFHVTPVSGKTGGSRVWGIRAMSLEVSGRTLAPAKTEAPTTLRPDGRAP